MAKHLLPLICLLALLGGCMPPADGTTSVTLVADGEARVLSTEALTVHDLLVEAGITLEGNDRVTPAESTFIEDGITVRVIRVEERTEVVEREIPFERQTVRDTSIPRDETRLLQSGVTGLEELTYRIIIEDGIEVDRQLVRRVMLKEPRAEMVLIGAQPDISPVPITGTIAFMANQNAWVMQTTSPNQRRLTDASDLDGHAFSLSPGGTHLLFTRAATQTESSRLNTLWVVETTTADAEPVRLVAENVLWADWAPDCRSPTGGNCRIAYTTGVPAEGNPGWKAENDLWIAWPRVSDGRLLRPRAVLAPSAGGSYGWWGTTYAWSPDGRQVAYARADEVGVVSVYAGEREVLAQFSPYRTYASWAWTPTVSWSPGGAFIITTLHGAAPTGEPPEDSPVFDVWALAIDGTIEAKLSTETGMWAAPRYAQEADWVVFGRARSPYNSQSSSYDLHIMDRDGSDRRQLFPQPGDAGLEYLPGVTTWGPTGDQLLVIYQGNLYLIDVLSDQLHQLTSEQNVSAARWAW